MSNKNCLCGRTTTKEFEINHGKKIFLCPYCAYLIMKQDIIQITNEEFYQKIAKKITNHRPIREGGQILDEVLDPPSPRPQ